VNKTPYGDGWMVKIKMKNPEELTQLLSADGYKKMLEV